MARVIKTGKVLLMGLLMAACLWTIAPAGAPAGEPGGGDGASIIYVGNVGFDMDKMLNDADYMAAFLAYYAKHTNEPLIVSMNGLTFNVGDYLNAPEGTNMADFANQNPANVPSGGLVWDGSAKPEMIISEVGDIDPGTKTFDVVFVSAPEEPLQNKTLVLTRGDVTISAKFQLLSGGTATFVIEGAGAASLTDGAYEVTTPASDTWASISGKHTNYCSVPAIRASDIHLKEGFTGINFGIMVDFPEGVSNVRITNVDGTALEAVLASGVYKSVPGTYNPSQNIIEFTYDVTAKGATYRVTYQGGSVTAPVKLQAAGLSASDVETREALSGVSFGVKVDFPAGVTSVSISKVDGVDIEPNKQLTSGVFVNVPGTYMPGSNVIEFKYEYNGAQNTVTLTV